MSDEQFKKYSERLKGTVVDPESGEEHQTYPKLFEYLISRVGKPLPEEEPGKFQGKVSPSVMARKFEVELPSEDGEGLEEGPQGKQTSTRQFVEDEPFDLRFAKYVTSKGKILGRRKPEIFETRKAKPEERMERLMYPKGLTKAPSYALTEPDPTGGGEYVLNPESPSMSGLGNESVDITSLHEIPPNQKQLNPVYQTGDVGAEGSPQESMHKLLLQKQALGSSPEQQLENLLQGIVPEQEERTLRPLPNPKPDLDESPAFTRKSVNILKGRASRLRSPLELRKAGFQGLWITGRADKPVYLSIRDQHIEIHPASHLWGLDTYSTQSAVAGEWGGGKPRIAVIGPAGESLIPFALILAYHGRVAGRTGMGAVMGSKNLKAIAVEGHGQIPIHDPSSFSLLRSEANRQLRADAMTKALHELGSGAAADYFDYLGEMPKRYFQQDIFDGATRISGSSVAESLLVGVSTCHACVIACGRVIQLGDGKKRKGPEYETLVGFGPNLCLSDPVFVTQMGELCDRYGMDSISLNAIPLG